MKNRKKIINKNTLLKNNKNIYNGKFENKNVLNPQ